MGVDKVKEENVKFFDKTAEYYDKSLLGWWFRLVQREVLKELELRNNMKVLDVGCGTGYLVEKAAREVDGGLIRGVDVSPEMVKVAQRRIQRIKNAEVVVADAEKLPYSKKVFDGVVSTLALHHFPDAQVAVREMARVAKKDGKIVLVDVQMHPLWLMNNMCKLEPGFVRMYSDKEVDDMLAKEGFQIIKRRRVGLAAVLVVGRRISIKKSVG
mgnify:CR=1 FL=1